jgi:vacuolar-type H+-ATPase subunit I/STV1
LQFPKPSELAERIKVLESREAKLAQRVKLLEKEKAETEAVVTELKDKRAELQREVDELSVKRDNLGRALAEILELVQRFRQELMALGWYPLGEMDTRELAFITFPQWVSGRQFSQRIWWEGALREGSEDR